MRLTPAQARRYLAAIACHERAALREALIIARGAQADAKDYKALLKELE